jgi:haloacetate dehalogenase
MFDGFAHEQIHLRDALINVRYGGVGPPVLLLHGHPRTHAAWSRVAPLLAASYSVVCPDLRGFGQSSKPVDTPDHAQSSKRAKAQDCLELMQALGHDRFVVVGHDRGSQVAYRLALDHPTAISGLVIMEGVPTVEALERCRVEFATRWWHWFFFAQPEKPERAINADPDAWYGVTAEQMEPDAFADVQRAIHDPETVHAMVEDYRAGLGIDRLHDEEARAQGLRVQCPMLCMWATQDDLEMLYGDVLAVWKPWTTDLIGTSMDCGHHMAEEQPDRLAVHLVTFLDQVYAEPHREDSRGPR